MQRKRQDSATDPLPTFIDINRNYTLPGLCRALGVEERTVRDARANGLKAKLFGERRLIFRGTDIDQYLKTKAPEAPAPKGKAKSH